MFSRACPAGVGTHRLVRKGCAVKKRSAEIIRRLIEAPSHRLRLVALMDDYHISRKTLNTDIETAAVFALNSDGTPMLVCGEDYVTVAPGADLAGLSDLLDGMDLYEYRLSFEERTHMIVCSLLMLGAHEWRSMQQLADTMFVTRNTVISDMKAVNEFLARHGISMESRSKLGLRLQAEPAQARSALIGLLAAILDGRSVRRDYFSHAVISALGFPCDLETVVDATRRFLMTRNVILPVNVEHEIVACLETMLSLVSTGSLGMLSIRDDELAQIGLKEERQLDLIGELIRFVGEQVEAGPLSLGQIGLIERTVLGRNLAPQVRRFDDFDLYCVITRFLFLVGRGLDIEIHNDDLLVESLLSHLKSLVSWSADSFEINVSGPSGVMVDMVEAAAEPHFQVLEDYLSRSMDASMRASVVIHICAALYRSESSLRSCNVTVACPGSVATSSYLEAQLKSYFKINVVQKASVRGIESGEVDLQKVDCIISTVAIMHSPVPVVVVSPVLTVDDLNRIQALVFRVGREQAGVCANQDRMLSRLAGAYAQGGRRKIEYLNRALAHVLDMVDRIESEATRTSPLLNMIECRFIRIADSELTWRDAMRLASEDLMNEGYFTRSYVDRAIGNVEEYGSYIVLNRGIALAHAGSEDGVFKDGLSLLVSKYGVEFDGGERVHLLFFFSQVADSDYLGLFRDVVRLGNDQTALGRVSEVTSPDDAYRLLIELLIDYTG